jgi:nucleotide-binding universal stress UspA family protein
MTSAPNNTILAGVDGSDHSADALALALTLAPVLDATVLGAWVHPYADREVASVLGRSDEIADAVHHHMRELGMPADERVIAMVPDRVPAVGLREIAERRDAALITLGASRRSLLGRVLLGGTAERLLAGAPAPVAIAPAGYAHGARGVGIIGVAFDGSVESMNALEWAKALALAARSRLRLVTVHDPPTSAMPGYQGLPMVAQDEALEAWLKRRLAAAERDARADGVDADSLFLRGDPAALLAQQAGALDLLVTGSRGHGRVSGVLLGSVSGPVARNAEGPVVVVPRGYRGSVSSGQPVPDLRAAAGAR